MWGLIRKDIYNLRETLGPTLVTAVCVGLLLMVRGNPGLFVMVLPLVGGALAAGCVQQDEAAGWDRYVCTTPLRRSTVVLAKYVLWLGLTLLGLVAGVAVSWAAGAVLGGLAPHRLGLYAVAACFLAASSGSGMIYCTYRFGSSRANVCMVLCYAIPTGLLVALLVCLRRLGLDFYAGSVRLWLTILLPAAGLALGALLAAAAAAAYCRQQF